MHAEKQYLHTLMMGYETHFSAKRQITRKMHRTDDIGGPAPVNRE
jgi:hypothetical protein